MKKKNSIVRQISISFILLCASIVLADGEYVRGKVIDENGNPVSGALVKLINHECADLYTNEDGEFALIEDASIRVPVQLAGKEFNITAINRGKALSLKLNGTGKNVKVELFSGNGSKILTKNYNDDRVRNEIISLKNVARGLILARVTAGNDAGTFRIIPDLAVSSASSVVAGKRSSTGSIAKRKSEIIDSVMVVCRSYRNSLVGIDSYTTDNLEITLTKSNPWIPDGNLEYNGAMVKIQASGYDFEMGSPQDMWNFEDYDMKERPIHTVSFTYDFWMDTTEITQKEYSDVMMVYDGFEGLSGLPYGRGDNYPIYDVSYGDVALFCNARSKRDGYDTVYTYTSISNKPGKRCVLSGLAMNETADGYRLPTEAEWEYAYKGGTFTDYYWGKNHSDYKNDENHGEVNEYAVWANNSWDMGSESEMYGVHPVAELLPNAYGLYDMAGNLSEYTNNPAYLFSYGSVTDPTVSEYNNTNFFILRGGNWSNNITHLRSANRSFEGGDYSLFYIGFRTVRVER